MDYPLSIEAASLSTVNQLAAHPPMHHADVPVAAPLVLYIARVPGSRDVFLTPMKPKDKVVSYEDVQSSLYYVHINSEHDHYLLEDVDPISSVNTDAAYLSSPRQHIIRRKPMVPPRSPARLSPPADGLPSPPRSPPRHCMPARKPVLPPRKPTIGRKPVLPEVTNTAKPRTVPDLPDIPRRPLPAVPDEPPFEDSLHDTNVHLLRHVEHSDVSNPYSRTFEPEVESPTFEPGTLTLIRRDPGSNNQWNVACICDSPVQEVSSLAALHPSAARRVKKGGAPLYLDITNPGYASFTGESKANVSASPSSSGSDLIPDGVFRRRLYMPGSRYAEHRYGNQQHWSIESAESLDMRRSICDRASSSHSFDSPPSTNARSRGYNFTSPWNGLCEFSTGASGKTLKCKHTCANSRVDVSELKFNLPTSSRTVPNAAKRASYLHTMGQSGGDMDEVPTILIGEDGRIDLTLGQEKAGGGFGGKHAKLGKLIIQPEGLVMLDLLVAANVGLWWRAYERA